MRIVRRVLRKGREHEGIGVPDRTREGRPESDH
jgi:hypothetical protein